MEAIILGNDHYNTLNVVRALGQESIRVYAIIVSEGKSFVLKSKYLYKGVIVHAPDAKMIVDNFSNKDRKIPLFATCDVLAAFLDNNYDYLSQFFILPSVKMKQGLLVQEMDKNNQLEHAAAAGFDVPGSVKIDLHTIPNGKYGNIKFPCIIKPEESIGGSKNDFRICYDSDGLTRSLNNLSGHLSQVLVQDFIPNDEVILIAGVRTNSGKNYIFGEVNKYKHGKKFNNLGLNCMGVLTPDSEIANSVLRYIDSIDYHGCYSVEVVRTRTTSTLRAEVNYFMEINLRTDGLLYFYTKAGINYPAIWVNSCYGIEKDIVPSKKKIYGMNEFLYIRNSLSLSIIGDVFKTNVFSTLSLSDIKPFIYRFLYHA